VERVAELEDTLAGRAMRQSLAALVTMALYGVTGRV
jgi:hypothetical protein